MSLNLFTALAVLLELPLALADVHGAGPDHGSGNSTLPDHGSGNNHATGPDHGSGNNHATGPSNGSNCAHTNENWTYDKSACWSEHYPHCASGHGHQSPIDLTDAHANVSQLLNDDSFFESLLLETGSGG